MIVDTLARSHNSLYSSLSDAHVAAPGSLKTSHDGDAAEEVLSLLDMVVREVACMLDCGFEAIFASAFGGEPSASATQSPSLAAWDTTERRWPSDPKQVFSGLAPGPAMGAVATVNACALEMSAATRMRLR